MSIDTSALPPYVDETGKKKQKFAESYTDYPKEAVENARRAVAYAEANGWGDCGMATGKARASQLANEEPVSEDTIARMASFERHRQNSNTPYGEGCGKLMWDAWGGDAGIEWAQRKLKQIRNEEFAAQGIILPRGEKVVLQAEDQNYDRGLVVELKDDGGYDVQYWYDNPDNIEPVEVKIDGETITKSGNLVYLGYHPELEEFASVDELSVGDEVSWKTADKNPRGRIREIVKGAKKVPGVDFEIQGTEEDPGYIIEIYEEVEGKWEPTGKYVGRKADSILKNVELQKEVYLNSVLKFAKSVGISATDLKVNGLNFTEETENMDLKFAKGYTVYKYTGSVGSDTRDFCREMVAMDLFYTFEDIKAMSDREVNPGFGLGGADTYDIWKYKGGPNCKHRWTKFYVNEDGGYENKGAAPGIAGEKPNDMANNGYAFAAIEDKRELVGPVAIPDIEIPRKDKQGNLYFVRFSKEVVKRMAEKFMREQKLSESNIQHDSSQDGKSYVYESWIIEHPEDKANSVYNLNLPVGSWVIKMRVTDPGVWAKVKEGEVKGFSLEGSFMDRADWEQYQKDREIYNKVIRILKNS
jgi:hypothetical protein